MKVYKSYARKIRLVLEPGNENFRKAKIKSPNDAAEYARQFWDEDLEIYESVFAIFLNRASNVTSWAKISQGGISGSIFDPVLITKMAIDTLSSGVIVVHNHPSENTEPSKADIAVTKVLKENLALFKIDLLDHIIITKESFESIMY